MTEIERRVAKLEAAIRNHRDQRGDDRCWIDDRQLYAVLEGNEPEANTALPPREQFLSNCARYHASRQNPEHSYETVAEREATLKSQVSKLEAEVRLLTPAANVCTDALELIRTDGAIDGAHHKQWVLDHVVRILTRTPAGYAAWVAARCAGVDGPDTYDWDEGIPP